MLIATLDTRFTSFLPTPDNYESYDEYLEELTYIKEILEESIYINNRLELKGLDLHLMDEDFYDE